jgi:two-component system, cell cycle sensor histidine kinase and response regulator CckA
MADKAKKTEKYPKPPVPVPDERGAEKLQDQARGTEAGYILLVDDDEMIQKFGRMLLGQMGFDVLSAYDGREAMEVFHREKENIRCVVLDLVMPVMDGAATLDALRLAAPHMPVVLCSAYGVEEVERLCALDAFTSVLEKPFEIKAFRSAIFSLLEKVAA